MALYLILLFYEHFNGNMGEFRIVKECCSNNRPSNFRDFIPDKFIFHSYCLSSLVVWGNLIIAGLCKFYVVTGLHYHCSREKKHGKSYTGSYSFHTGYHFSTLSLAKVSHMALSGFKMQRELYSYYVPEPEQTIFGQP